MSGMSHIGSAGGGGPDQRVDALVGDLQKSHKNHRKHEAAIEEVRSNLKDLEAALADHLSNHPAPHPMEMPPPEVISHHQDVHHTYVERITDEEQVKIETALAVAQRAAERAEDAWSIAEDADDRLEQTEEKVKQLLLDIPVQAARYTNDLEAIQEEFKSQLNRIVWCFAAGLGVAIVIGIYNAL